MKRAILWVVLTMTVVTVSTSALAVTPLSLSSEYGPIFHQDVDAVIARGVNDFIAKVDFDGDVFTNNNWDNLSNFENVGLDAYIYYSVTETVAHWFILYGVYHPRDWDNERATNQIDIAGITSAQHENDMEGVLLIVRRDESEYGTLEAVCTMAHHQWLRYPVAEGIEVKDRDSDGEIHFMGTHPIVLVQAEGHGIYGAPVSYASIQRWDPSTDYFGIGIQRWNEVGFPNCTGIIYFPAKKAQLAEAMREDKPGTYCQNVGYELISFKELWDLRNDFRTFTSGGAFTGTHDGYDDPDPGRNNPNNDYHAHAPWGWKELRNPLASGSMISAPGEIFFHPAEFVAERFTGFSEFSFEYTLNNPPWIIPSSEPLISFEIQGKGPGETVVLDKGIKPLIKLIWNNTESFGDFTLLALYWQGEFLWYYALQNIEQHSALVTTREPLEEDGYFQLWGRTDKENSQGELYEVWTRALWAKVVPHQTSYYVSAGQGSDELGDGTRENPYASIGKAYDQVSDYRTR
ncbi:hypothetical protein L6279_03405, partial [Candidatus Parcubacteria bacterium]|nr:hypothetical protein [Candidatus Parcubacteria bacterium]MCG2693127.1 hypothetical protein [Candidatus Parcubacteria bacterium]